MIRTSSPLTAVLLLGLAGCHLSSYSSDAGESVDGREPYPDCAGCPKVPSPAVTVKVAWSRINSQAPAWYATDEALTVAEYVLQYQGRNGGWPKNIDMTKPYTISADSQKEMIDNGATTTQLVFLANMMVATNCPKYSYAFNRGLDYLFAAQYANGGWPQVYPIEPKDYSRRITFNDKAMTNVVDLLRDIMRDAPRYVFVDSARRERATTAYHKAIDCILKCQITVKGVKTGWCQQHDEVTLAPAGARAYELPSISGQEGAAVLSTLMNEEQPTQVVIDAIQAATAWFDKVKLLGIRVESFTDSTGFPDRRVVSDPAASPLWARFYDLETEQPFFVGRDGVKHANFADIEQERRTGYDYYSGSPKTPLGQYEKWRSAKCPSCPSVLPVPDGGAPADTATLGDGSAPVDADDDASVSVADASCD